MIPLHEIPNEVTRDSRLFWAIRNVLCDDLCEGSSIVNHHACARRYFGPIEDPNTYATIYCECRCQTSRISTIQHLHYVEHSFRHRTEEHWNVCFLCAEGKHPIWSGYNELS